MHIKQIIIQGFKSYRDQTIVEPFSPRHNVIVGRNGSGKSNFFAAIRYVLSDAYTSMSREERQGLLHEGSGPATMSAYVEIIFDNQDNRFPTGKDEVVLRRTIGLKKDEYSLDKKSVTKSDVMNLLESAGFSQSNPYYIVPQGRITSLTNAKDHERLQLLKEVAGTRVYEQRRIESLKIIEETKSKRIKINELLAYIEERLEELEEEKEELRHFQEQDRKRRCLEYTIYHREQTEITSAIEANNEKRQRALEISNQQQQAYYARDAEINKLEASLSNQKHKLDLLEAEKRELEEEREDYYKAKAQLDLMIKDMEENVRSNEDAKARSIEDLEQLELDIQRREQELESLLPAYEAKVQEEAQLQEQLTKANMQRQALYAKQGRSVQFSSQRERDDWLNLEIQEIQNNIEAQNKQLADLNQEKEAITQKLSEIRESILQSKRELDEQKQEMNNIETECLELRAKRDELTDRRKELWRQDAKFSTSVRGYKDELDKAERALQGTMDKLTSSGLSAIAAMDIEGVYGPLYSLFSLKNDRYRTAVDVIAGTSLFHVVVENDDTASRVLENMTKGRLGRVTFMPLNRLHPPTIEYPSYSDMKPMIECLDFDARYAAAIQQVFNKAIICPNLEVASEYARKHGLNAVTLEGDRVDRRGTLTGGFIDVRQSRFEAIKNISEWREKYNKEQQAASSVKEELVRLDQEITRILGEIQRREARYRRLQDSHDPLVYELNSKIKQEERLMEYLETKEKSSQSILSNLETLRMQIQTLREELGTPLQNLTEEEQRQLENLNANIDNLKKQLVECSTERSRLEQQKNKLQNLLNANLTRRRDELRDKISGVRTVYDERQREQRLKELRAVDRTIADMNKRLATINTELDETKETIKSLTEKLREEKDAQIEEGRNLSQLQKKMEKYISKQSLLLQRRDECTRNIRELGVLPEEAFEGYNTWESERLLEELHRANEELKKYGHVNKKAYEQYGNFVRQRDSLMKRKEDLDSSESAIHQLIEHLDQRKDEAIQRTFKQVAKYFADVWEKLVPSGRGQLIMQRRTEKAAVPEGLGREEEEEEEERPREGGIVENYTGVAIKVSFNSKTDEGLRMQQLSGGQKSLVALALIFAIQQCDPAPFYLFDEIDANLDEAYRTSVASMIHELSDKAQFITTTFRPELVANADQFYGVTFANKVSRLNLISKEDALKFVEQREQQQ
ncbi:uncharacterized protein VTP21DRAFT_5005 [Calcarisporiella thermophila]|uniref:uncharacterized protein n=1 Tax=Calcarisporiella thermophila TaxID=911321 RepID=UPI0037447641